MENKTVWSFVCERASILPHCKGWIRKTSDSASLPKKTFSKDIYKLHRLVSTYLNIVFIEIAELIHFGVCNKLLKERCEVCFDDYPNVQLNSIQNLLRFCSDLQEPIKYKKFSRKSWHYHLYRGVDWAKETTVAQFIEKIVDGIMKYNVCSNHTDNLKFKRERLSVALTSIFLEQVDCFILLSVSCNYKEDSFTFPTSHSPMVMATIMPLQILKSVLFAIYCLK